MVSKRTRHRRRTKLLESGKTHKERAYLPDGRRMCKSDLVVENKTPTYEVVRHAFFQAGQAEEETGKYTRIYIKEIPYDISHGLEDYINEGHESLIEDYFLVSYYSPSRKYLRATVALGYRTDEGRLVIQHDLNATRKNTGKRNEQKDPVKTEEYVIIGTPYELAEACKQAIKDVSGFRYHGYFADHLAAQNDIRNYQFQLTLNGKVANMRADCVFAMAKHDWKNGTDAYGNKPLGVVISGKKTRQFKLLYPSKNNKPNLSNIDHVIPQATGGLTRIANLQMMGQYENSVKSDRPVDCLVSRVKNAIASEIAMFFFTRSFWRSRKAFDEKTRKDVFVIARQDFVYSTKVLFGL